MVYCSTGSKSVSLSLGLLVQKTVYVICKRVTENHTRIPQVSENMKLCMLLLCANTCLDITVSCICNCSLLSQETRNLGGEIVAANCTKSLNNGRINETRDLLA